MSKTYTPSSKRAIVVAFLVATLVLTCGKASKHAPTILADSGARVTHLFSPTPAFAESDGYGQDSGRVSVADIAERTVASVVNISAVRVVKQNQRQLSPFENDPFFREFFGHPFRGMPEERRQRSLGSGVLVSKDGVVLTNNHVVEHAEEVEVSFADGRDFSAKIVGTDPKSDVAVLRIEGDLAGLTPLPTGDSSELRLGEIVIAIGNPFGVGQTVTMGIVSAIGRANVGIVDYEDFIQTDAAINPGNSGGALVNMRGELVGINTAILSRSGGYQGIGFAIPSNLAKPVMKSLLEHGKVVRGWLGVSIQDLNEDLAKGLNLRTDKGVLVSDVGGDTPAKAAGFQRGDVIVKMDGKAVAETSKLRNRIALLGPRAKAKFEVLRNGKSITLEAILGELPGEPGTRGELTAKEGALDGAELGNLDDQARRRFGISNEVRHGVVVVGVKDTSEAQRAGLRVGDVIVELNRKAIMGLEEFEKGYRSAKGALLLLVQRGPATLYIAIRK